MQLVVVFAVAVVLLVVTVRPRRWRVTVLLAVAEAGKQMLDTTNAEDAADEPGAMQYRAVAVLRCCSIGK